MWKRKSRLLDRQFQLKTTFSVIAIALIAYLIIIASAVIITNYNNRAIRSDIKVLKKSVSGVNVKPEFSIRIANLKKNLDRNFLLVSVIISVVLLQVITLYLFLIRLTHRISGPIYVISRHIEDIISGREPELRGLRDKDELQDFYDKFAEMIEKIEFSEKNNSDK
jgi:signal transduction histidine kinase